MGKGILFDKDGTLITYASAWNDSIFAFIEQVKAQAGAQGEEIAQALGVCGTEILPNTPIVSGTYEEVAEVLQQYPIFARHIDLVDDVRHFFKAHLREHLADVALIGDVATLFQQLKAAGFTLGIATSDDYDVTKLTLAHFDLLPYIDFIGTGDLYPPKPDPTVLYAFAEQQKLAVQDIIMVGDSFVDVALGNLARRGIGVQTGVATDMQFPKNCAVYPSIHEVPYQKYLA